jgi:hypothetical protein
MRPLPVRCKSPPHPCPCSECSLSGSVFAGSGWSVSRSGASRWGRGSREGLCELRAGVDATQDTQRAPRGAFDCVSSRSVLLGDVAKLLFARTSGPAATDLPEADRRQRGANRGSKQSGGPAQHGWSQSGATGCLGTPKKKCVGAGRFFSCFPREDYAFRPRTGSVAPRPVSFPPLGERLFTRLPVHTTAGDARACPSMHHIQASPRAREPVPK